MSGKYSTAALSTIYDRVIELSESASLVETRGKVGIINTVSGNMLVNTEYSSYKNYRNSNIVILYTECQDRSLVFNSANSKFIVIKDKWRVVEHCNGLIFLREVAMTSKRYKTQVIREDIMKIIVHPTDITKIYTDKPNGHRAAMRYFNAGYCVDGVLYYIRDDYRILVDKDIYLDK